MLHEKKNWKLSFSPLGTSLIIGNKNKLIISSYENNGIKVDEKTMIDIITYNLNIL